MKLSDQSKHDDVANNVCVDVDGGEGSSISSMFRPSLGPTMPPGRGSKLPSVPGILKGRVKHEF